MWKLNFSLHLSIDLNFRHTSKKIEGGSPKKILEKKNVFPKKYVELRTFDGTSVNKLILYIPTQHYQRKGLLIWKIRHLHGFEHVSQLAARQIGQVSGFHPVPFPVYIICNHWKEGLLNLFTFLLLTQQVLCAPWSVNNCVKSCL